MQRPRRFMAAVALAAGVFALLAGAASAHGGGHRDGGYRGTTLPGVLEASGDGIAAASGRLTLKLCAEDGLLITKGGVIVEEGGTYEDTVSWLGLNVYFGFSGCAAIGPEEAAWGGFGALSYGGGRTAALAVGTGLELKAVGTGKGLLIGEGEWSMDNGDSGAWSDDPTILNIGGKRLQGCDVEAMHDGGYDDDDDDEHSCPTPEPTPAEPEEPGDGV